MEERHGRIHYGTFYARGDRGVGPGADPAGGIANLGSEQGGLDGASGSARILPFRNGRRSPEEIAAMKLGMILAVTLGVIAGEALGRMVGLDGLAAKFGAA